MTIFTEFPPHWTDERIAHFRKRQNMTIAAGWTDAEIATKVRMLLRDDLMHEFIITSARDRIAILSRDVHELTFALNQLLDSLPDKEGRFMPSYMKAPLFRACRLLERITGKPTTPPLPEPIQASEQEVCDVLGDAHDMDTGLMDFAKAILRKFHVFPRETRT